jgi:hypothetical protein
MAEAKKKREEPVVYAGGKTFPAKPGLMDYVTEAFEPTNTRAQLDTIRKRRANVGS